MFKFEKDRLNIWDARFMQGEKMRCFTKLLYMYFLTSSLSNKLGVYQISNTRIKCDLNLDDGELITAMHELKECKKVRRCGSYIIIKDATYYIKKDKKTLQEIETIYNTLPNKVKERVSKDVVKLFEDAHNKKVNKKIKHTESLIEKGIKDIEALNEKLKDEKLKGEGCLFFDATEINPNDRKLSPSIKKTNQFITEINSNETKFKTWDSFTVEPSPSSLQKMNLIIENDNEEVQVIEDEEEVVISSFLSTGWNEELNERALNKQKKLFQCDALPSDITLKKASEQPLLITEKKEMSDEELGALFTERLAPIYAKQKAGELLPKVDIVMEALEAMRSVIKDHNVAIEPIKKKSIIDFEEFDKQNKSFEQDVENIQILNDKASMSELPEAKPTSPEYFGLISKERKSKEERMKKEMNSKNYITVYNKERMSKIEFDQYINALNDDIEKERKILYEKDAVLIKKAWQFCKEQKIPNTESYELFCDEFESAKTIFETIGINLSNRVHFENLLKDLSKCFNTSCKRNPLTTFLRLAQIYGIENGILEINQNQ